MMSAWSEAELPPAGTRVVVGLSGGVDSAVAALRLKERGCEVFGVTTRNFCLDDIPGGDRLDEHSCCSQEAVAAARELASDLGFPHQVLDLAPLFAREVIDDFVREYGAGRTPNPCVRCNRFVRFPSLLDHARRLGASRVATGHYLRLVRHPRSGWHLARAIDQAKDQSYYLHGLSPEILASCVFPLGRSSKQEVREEARRHGLACADAPESQEICFVPGGDRSWLTGEGKGPGEIVDSTGRVVGRHRGLPHYTVGQRRGLGLGGASPHYVTRIEAEENRIRIGGEDELLRRVLRCDRSWLRDPGEGADGLVARTRSRHAGRAVERIEFEGDRLTVILRDPDRAPAPGQSVVLYRDDVVVGGGRLQETA